MDEQKRNYFPFKSPIVLTEHTRSTLSCCERKKYNCILITILRIFFKKRIKMHSSRYHTLFSLFTRISPYSSAFIKQLIHIFSGIKGISGNELCGIEVPNIFTTSGNCPSPHHLKVPQYQN